VNWEGLAALAKSASDRYQQRRTSCSNLQVQPWTWVRAKPPSGVKGVPSSRYSRCQFPRGTSRPRSEPAQERQLRLHEIPSPPFLFHRKGWLGASLLETSNYSQRILSSDFGEVEVAERYRSTRMTGAPAAGVGPEEDDFPGGDSRARHPSSPVPRSPVWISYSACPAV